MIIVVGVNTSSCGHNTHLIAVVSADLSLPEVMLDILLAGHCFSPSVSPSVMAKKGGWDDLLHYLDLLLHAGVSEGGSVVLHSTGTRRHWECSHLRSSVVR